MTTPHNWAIAGHLANAVLDRFSQHVIDGLDCFDFIAAVEDECREYRVRPLVWADAHDVNREHVQATEFCPSSAMVFQCIIEETLDRALLCSTADIQRAEEAGADPIAALVGGGFA